MKQDTEELRHKLAIRHSVQVAKKRLKELSSKKDLSRANIFEIEMTKDLIDHGEKILGYEVECFSEQSK